MKPITLKLTVEELKLLVSLASDQLFRRQFIDPKMPGYKPNPEELTAGKALVGRLRLLTGQGPRNTTAAPAAVTEFAPNGPSKAHNRIPDAF